MKKLAVLVVLVAIADFVLKRIAQNALMANERVFDSWIDVIYFENTGITAGIQLSSTVIFLITAITVILLVYVVHRSANSYVRFGAFIMLVGAMGNAMDRLLHGYVIDYLLIGTAVINLSDILIITGLIYLIRYTK